MCLVKMYVKGFCLISPNQFNYRCLKNITRTDIFLTLGNTLKSQSKEV